MRAVHREEAWSEALVVDTCNRTEVYFVPRREGDDLGYLLGHIAALKGTATMEETSAFYRHDDIDGLVAQNLAGRQAEVDRYGGRFTASDREELKRFTESLCRKLLHGPLSFLSKLGSTDSPTETLQTMDVIRQIFDLDSLEGKG